MANFSSLSKCKGKPFVKYCISINSLKPFFFLPRKGVKGIQYIWEKKIRAKKMWHRMAVTCILSYLESFHYEV